MQLGPVSRRFIIIYRELRKFDWRTVYQVNQVNSVFLWQNASNKTRRSYICTSKFLIKLDLTRIAICEIGFEMFKNNAFEVFVIELRENYE